MVKILRPINFLLLSVFLLLFFIADAQTYLGISANVGNRLSFTPTSTGLERPVSISGNLCLAVHKGLKRDWTIQYRAGFGVLGYTLKVLSIDTIAPQKVSTSSLDYYNFYASLGILIGKEMLIGKKKLLLGFGGGATYYLRPEDLAPYTIGWFGSDQALKKTFYAEFNSPANKLSPFANVDVQLKLNRFLIVGLGYSHHFQKVLTGTYEFYYTETPSKGKISLYQSELNVRFLVKISKDKKEAP